MKDIRVLADNILALRKQYRAVLEVGEYLDEVAGLEQARQEILNAIQKATVARDEAVRGAEKAQADLRALEDKKQGAIVACDDIIADAEEKAQEIVDKADAASKALLAEANKRKVTLAGEIEALKGQVAQLAASAQEKRAELQALEQQVADLRKAASQIAASFRV